MKGSQRGMATVRCLSLLLFTAAVLVAFGAHLVSAGQMRNEHPSKPGDWICLTTAGGSNATGGTVVKSWCGKVCDKHKQSTVWIGYLGAVIAILFFGSNFIPIKQFDTGDGVFFQWILCIGIWLVGLATNIILYQPPFFIPTLIGGAFWTTGNLMVVPIVKMIGLTMGLTVWGATNMLTGWFLGVFILKEDVRCQGLNYGGVATVIISIIILAFVKSEGKNVKSTANGRLKSETTALLSDNTNSLEGSLRDRVLQKEAKRSPSIQGSSDDKLTFSPPSTQNHVSPDQQDADFSWVDRLGIWPRRILGFSLSLISGIFYGLSFLPVQYMKLCNDHAHSCYDVDYIFGQYCGIFLASTFYLVIYASFRRNRPKIYPRLIVPGIISGIMWGIAMVGWFMANNHLSLGVSFPLVTAGPGFVSSAWGIFYFREIKGWFNRVLYFVAFIISVGGLVMDGLSRCTVEC